MALTAALALHVVDEAAGDFLSFYNPMVLRAREAFPLFPAPTLTFPVWIGGLVAAIALLVLLTPAAARPSRGMRRVAVFFAGFMVLNGAGHIFGSMALGFVIPGLYSSPVLLAASINLLASTRRR